MSFPTSACGRTKNAVNLTKVNQVEWRHATSSHRGRCRYGQFVVRTYRCDGSDAPFPEAEIDEKLTVYGPSSLVLLERSFPTRCRGPNGAIIHYSGSRYGLMRSNTVNLPIDSSNAYGTTG
jgi:hypothetical protein